MIVARGQAPVQYILVNLRESSVAARGNLKLYLINRTFWSSLQFAGDIARKLLIKNIMWKDVAQNICKND